MATSYSIKGILTTTAATADLATLRMVAYKFLSSSMMQIFGVADVNSSGEFILEFERSAAGPEDVYIAPIPIEIEQFGIFNIQRTLVGAILSPRLHITSGDWSSAGTKYTYSANIGIPVFSWKMWAWLSEEFTVVGRAVKRVDESLLPLPFTWVHLADVDAPNPHGSGIGGAETDEEGNFNISFRRIAFFIDYASHPLPNLYGIEFWPDVIFSMTQIINGVKTEIYQEEEADARSKSEWDEPHKLLYVTLISDEGVTNDETYPPIAENFLIHGIGVVDPHSISDGYATTGPNDDLPNRLDCPFGRTLHIKGQFDTTGANPPKYYQVLYSRWTGATPPAESSFQVIEHEHWTASKYDAATHSWDPIGISPVSSVVAGESVYQIPDYTDITLTKKTRLIKWTSHRIDSGIARYPNGKYDLLVRAWDATGNPVTLNPLHPENNRLTVVIDNQWPKALLRKIGAHDILRTDEMQPYTPVCPVFSKVGDGPMLAIEFDATDANEHILQYKLSFITGHNFYVDTFVKRYAGRVGANETFTVRSYHHVLGSAVPTETLHPNESKLPGGFPSEVVQWNIGSGDVVKCAYQVRLAVWDRTINGYGYIHRSEDTMHFSIEP